MSDVTVRGIEGGPLAPARSRTRARSTLRQPVVRSPELYPGIIDVIRTVWRNGARFHAVADPGGTRDRGRETGARI